MTTLLNYTVGLRDIHCTYFILDLTGKAPKSASTSLAGTTHDLNLKTPYYSATVPIWLDLIESPSDWASSFLSEEASEVLAVLGGVVLVFPLPDSSSPPLSADQVRELIHHVGQVVDKGLGGWEWDGVRLAVGVGDGEPDEWDELCAEAGMEFVQLGGSQQGRNEFGGKLHSTITPLKLQIFVSPLSIALTPNRKDRHRKSQRGSRDE